MNKRKIAVGPGASSLILIAVVLALSVLTVLTMISARSDEALALRSVETREEVYGLFAAGEKSLARLDEVLVSALAEDPEDPDAYLAAVKANLPEGMKMKKDQVSWTEQADSRTLECAVQIMEPGAQQRTKWTLHSLTAGDIWEDDGFDDFDDWDDEDWGDEEEEEAGDEDWGDEEETDEASGAVSQDGEPEEGAAAQDEEAAKTTDEDGEEEFE